MTFLNRTTVPVSVRVAAIALVLMTAAAYAPFASASTTKERLDAAKQQYDALQGRIESQRDKLAQLQEEANRVASQVADAQARLDQIEESLAETRRDLDEARGRYLELRTQLDERARESFMGGSSSTMISLLSSESFGELSDRLEFVNRLTQSDSDLAGAVYNLGVRLEQDEAEQERLREAQVGALDALRSQQARLDEQFSSQQSLLGQIQADEREAAQLVEDLGREYQQEQAAAEEAAASASSGGAVTGGPGPFSACPVPGGAISNDFGAPRYGGGYHTHQGNDIFAPEGTPIHAPFSGNASSANNSLGGISVIVTGSQGYVYNAHMSGTGQLGAVGAGDVIGYVGNTGDAVGTSPHDHFEWHPGGGAAVDPYPYLVQAC